MAPFILRKPGGSTLALQSVSPLIGVSQAEQKVDLLTGDVFSLTIDSTEPLSIGVGDTLPVFGQLYTLNTTPAERKTGHNRYQYELTLEGPQYHMLRVIFFDTDVQGNALSSTFSLTGNLAFFAQVLFANLARVFSGAWGLGSVSVPGESTNTGGSGTVIDGADTDTKTLSFENENCLTVLQRLCAEWGTEFWVEYRPNDAPNRVLHIGPVGQSLSDIYSYGQGNGLYELSRRSIAGTGFVTRAYIFGGSKNLPVGYRGGYATRLQLPAPAKPAGSSYSPWESYVQDSGAIATYGLIEGTQVFEDIYPGRIGTVAEVVDTLSFTDPSLDFNPFAYTGTKVVNGQTKPIYDYIVDGLTPKVSFLTGQLAGYSFDLVKFFENNYILQLRSYTDDNGLVFPGTDTNSPFKIAVGDTYTLVDMKMPDAYVVAAENKLLSAGQAWLNENKSPAIEYALTVDEMFLQNRANDNGRVALASPPSFFTVGDSIRLIDTEMGIDQQVRITSFTRDALRPYKYTLTLGDTRRISQLQRVLSQQTSIKGLVREKTTEPVPGTQPQQVKTDIQAIKNTLVPIQKATNPLLSVTVVPAGFAPAIKQQLRHSLEVQSILTDDVREILMGTTLANAIKNRRL